MSRLLRWCEEREASDVHVQAGRPLRVRIHGRLSRVPAEVSPPLSVEQVHAMLRECCSPRAGAASAPSPRLNLTAWVPARTGVAT